MNKLPVWIAVVISLVLGLIIFSPVDAQRPTPSDDEVNAIAKQLYCPVCENIPLDVCPTQACTQWRGVIREKLAEGKTEQEIKDYFVLYYGDRVLAEPPRRGLNWLVYILPPIVLLGGGIILFSVLRSMRAAPGDTGATPGPQPEIENLDAPLESDEYRRRLEEELRKRQG